MLINECFSPPLDFYSNGSRETEAQGGDRESPGIYSVSHFTYFMLILHTRRVLVV